MNAASRPSRREFQLDGHRQRDRPPARASRRRSRAPRAASARPHPARTRSCRVAAPPGPRASPPARRRRRRRCAPTRASRDAVGSPPRRSAEIASSKSRALARVDRERRQAAQVAPAGRRLNRLLGGRARLALDRLLDSRAPAIEQQPLDQVAGHIRASEHARDLSPSVAPSPGLLNEHQIPRARSASPRIDDTIRAERDAPGRARTSSAAIGARWREQRLGRPELPRFSSTATTVPPDFSEDFPADLPQGLHRFPARLAR